MKKRITYSEIREVLQKKGYLYFDNNIPYNLNIIGIRADENKANKFDDLITLSYFDTKGNIFFYEFSATTDPGRYWLENPMRVEGTGIMVEGQYMRLFRRGLHKGYEALIQNTPVKLYRDNNNDDILDHDEDSIMEGMFNVNLHHAGKKSTQVDKWSAACQVLANIDDYMLFMAIVRKSLKFFPEGIFTYTLLNEKDFR